MMPVVSGGLPLLQATATIESRRRKVEIISRKWQKKRLSRDHHHQMVFSSGAFETFDDISLA
jgi:hypothetical protein